MPPCSLKSTFQPRAMECQAASEKHEVNLCGDLGGIHHDEIAQLEGENVPTFVKKQLTIKL